MCLHFPNILVVRRKRIIFFSSNSGGWNQIGSTRQVGHRLVYCTCPRWLWGPTVSPPVLVSSPDLGLKTRFLLLSDSCGLLMWDALSDERTGLSFTIAAGPHQYSHSQARVLWDSWPYITVTDLRLPKPGGPGPRIYIPQEQGGPVITLGTWFPFRRLLRLTGLRWRYLGPPPRGWRYSKPLESILNLRQQDMFMSSTRLGPENYCAGEDQQQL
jgi:hypothetical protein